MKIRNHLLLVLLAIGIAFSAHADLLLKQSTASQAIKIGPFVDSTDGNTEETALTIANTDVKLSKNGGTLASKNSGSCAHDANGWYTCTFDATDSNTVGRLQGFVHVAGALPVTFEVNVVEEAVYDALYGASALGYVANAPVNVAQFGGANGTFASGRPEVNMTHIAGSAVSTSTAQLGVNVVNAGATAWNSGAIGEATFATTAGSFKPLGIIDQGTAQAYTAGTPSLTLRSAAAFGDNTLTGSTAMICGSTQGYCQSVTIASNVGSTDVATLNAALPVAASGTVTYYLFGTASSTGGGGGLDAAATRAALGMSSANLDTQLAAIDDFVDTEVAAIKTKTDFLPSATAGAAGGLFIAGTNAATTITTGLTTTFAGNLTGSVASVSGAVGSVTGAVGSVTGAVGSVTGNVGGNVTGSVGSVASGGITAASIATDAIGAAELASDAATEIATATWATTMTEPAAKPAWGTSTMKQLYEWAAAWSINKVTQTATTKTLRNTGDSGNIVTCTVSDNGTTFTLSSCSP